MATYNDQDFLLHSDQLKPDGFIRSGNDSNYIKEDSDRILILKVGSDQYFPHSATFTGISVRIVFKVVENIFLDIYEQYPLPSRTVISKTTLGKMFNEENSLKQKILEETTVSDDTSFAIVRPIIRGQVDRALAFFEQFDTLEKVYNHAESLDFKERISFIAQPFDFRYTIIKKLMNAPDFEQYSQEGINYYQSENETLTANFAIALDQKLKSL